MKKFLFIGNASILGDNLKNAIKKDSYIDFVSTMSEKELRALLNLYNALLLDFSTLKDLCYILCTVAKNSSSNIIVLFLFPIYATEQNILNCYESGADDYLYTSLSSSAILLKKLDVLLNKKESIINTEKYQDQHMTLNFDSLTAVIDDAIVAFTPLEFKLLRILSKNPHIILTRQHILYLLWDRNGNYVEESSLSSMICRIRQRIDTENYHYIKTIYGIGYMWLS